MAFESIVEDEPLETPPDLEALAEADFNKGVIITNPEALATLDEDPPDPEIKPVLFAGLTEEQLTAKLALIDSFEEKLTKTTDKLNGYYGQLKQTVDQTVAEMRAGRIVSSEAFKAVTDYYGDPGFAEALAQDLAQLPFGASSQTVAPVIPEGVYVTPEQLAEREKALQTQLLTMAVPDWAEVAVSPEFNKWKTTLKPEDQVTLEETIDAQVLTNAFKSFGAWKEKQNERQNRLEQNVRPSSGKPVSNTRHTQSEEDAFNAGVAIAQKSRGLVT